MLELKKERLLKYYEGQGLTQRQIKNRIKKEELKEEEEKNQRKVEEMSINIEWKKSPTWGYCPRAYAKIKFNDGFGESETYKASGYGYDKESTVIADIFNEVLKYKLWDLAANENLDRKEIPYGIVLNDEFNHYYEGGVGVSCYYNIVKFLGGNMEHIANGKTFDVYSIKF